jgi:hypothetical protein
MFPFQQWALAALIRAKIALDGLNKETMELANENYKKLIVIDSQRAKMYEEMMSRLTL